MEEGQLQFHEAILTLEDIKDTQESIRMRVLNLFRKRGWFSKEEIKKMLSYENSGFSLDASVKIQSWDRSGLERVIRYCARPCFASENLRWNGTFVVYRLTKPTHKGQTFVQLDPLEFLDRIAAFIPLPYRHRRHYHGVFAPNSPLRRKVVAFAQQRIEKLNSPYIKNIALKANRVSLDWAELIKRIYEVDPLVCSKCGQTIKINGFVTHKAEIHRILKGIGWPIKFHEYDPPYDVPNKDICQLIYGTEDGFPMLEVQVHCDEIEPDPHVQESYSDPPHWQGCYDCPHGDENIDPPHWDN
jgi:Putative transposase